MDKDLQDLIISLKKQNANSVFELLKAQKRMADLEKKVTALEATMRVLLLDKENQIHESNRLTIAKLKEIKDKL
jgi:hypothetical protein